MPLSCRPADASEYDRLERLVLAAFEPVTWFQKVDREFGPLNGHNWRERWRWRLQAIFEHQIVLVGEAEGRLVAFSSSTLDERARLAYIDLLAVDRDYHGRGYGREMLRATLAWLKQQGAEHANLDCLIENDAANHLYRAEGFREVARHIRWFIRIP